MMRAHVRFASVFVLGAAFSVGCGGGSGGTGEDLETGLIEDTSTDTSGGEVEVDTGGEDSFNPMLDTGGGDTSMPDTAPVDTGSPDTGSPDTGTPDTGAPDTGPPDTGTVPDVATCEVGAACDDGDKCFTGKTLNASCVCSGGTAVVCMDTNACTTDTCEPATGCKFTTAADGTSCGAGKKCTAGVCADLCTVGANCDDANGCTTGEKFDATCACTGGTAVSCDDGNVCTADSCNPTSGCQNTPTSEGGMCATGKVCKAGSCVDPTASLPTINIISPAANEKIPFNSGLTTCQGKSFSVDYTAPLGFKIMEWTIIAPTSGSGGSCTGGFISYSPYYIDHTSKKDSLSGNATENVSLAGETTVGSTTGLWAWCTAPGASGNSLVSTDPILSVSPPGPGGGIYQPLSRSCFYDAKGGGSKAPPDTELTAQYTLRVRITDNAGNVVTATRKFWIYDNK